MVEVWRDAKSVFSAPLADLQAQLGRGQLAHRARCATTRPAPMPSTRRLARSDDPGLHLALIFDPLEDVAAPFIGGSARPKVAILREQGVNSHVEMSYALAQAGFETFDVHMSDLQAGRVAARRVPGLVACGGFSYGDTLGAGLGWARSILFNPRLADQFSAFFQRADSFALGVCNGCQMMSGLAEIIPGARGLAGLHAQPQRAVRGPAQPGRGARQPVDLLRRHGRQPHADRRRPRRGLCRFLAARRCRRRCSARCASSTTTAAPTTDYPFNPNGSPDGLTSVTTADGRFSVLMPHPERVFRNVQMSWTSGDRSQASPWQRMFGNARRWVG